MITGARKKITGNGLAAGCQLFYRKMFCFTVIFRKKIRPDFSCESSAKQRIHMKHQVLFSLKNNENILTSLICCSRDWRFKGKLLQ